MTKNSTLEFGGCIAARVGRYSEMTIPARRMLPDGPADWPKKLYPGSLNVLIKTARGKITPLPIQFDRSTRRNPSGSPSATGDQLTHRFRCFAELGSNSA